MDGAFQSADLRKHSPSYSESADAYRAVICTEGNHRVIVCKDDRQWIIQRSRNRRMECVWEGVSYVTTQSALTRLWHGLGCAHAPELDALPNMFRKGATV